MSGKGKRYRSTFLCTEKLEVEYFPCMCSYISNFIANVAANKEKPDNYRKETTTVRSCIERPFSFCGEYFVEALSCMFSLFI